MSDPTHCGHPAACITSSGEGTSSCAWCDEVARLTADLAEARLRLAIWSGQGVPEGWEAVADGEPYILRRRGGYWVAVDPRGRWEGWQEPSDEAWLSDRLACVECARIADALREAEAWLDAQEVTP